MLVDGVFLEPLEAFEARRTKLGELAPHLLDTAITDNQRTAVLQPVSDDAVFSDGMLTADAGSTWLEEDVLKLPLRLSLLPAFGNGLLNDDALQAFKVGSGVGFFV